MKKFGLLIFFLSFVHYAGAIELTEKKMRALIKNLKTFSKEIEHEPNLIDARTKEGRTLLMLAAEKAKNSIIDKLIDRGVNLEFEDKFGNRAIHYAVRNIDTENKFNTIKILIDNGAKVDVVNKNGQTPLHVLGLNLDFEEDDSLNEIINLFLQKNRNLLNQKDKEGDTPLHTGIKSYSSEKMYQPGSFPEINFIKAILEFEPDTNIQNNEGNTPAHLSVQYVWPDDNEDHDSVKLVKLLMASKTDFLKKNNEGNSPLHVLADYWNKPSKVGEIPDLTLINLKFEQERRLEIANLIINYLIDSKNLHGINILNKKNQTPLDIAVQTTKTVAAGFVKETDIQRKLVKFLEAHGAKRAEELLKPKVDNLRDLNAILTSLHHRFSQISITAEGA